MAGNTVFIYKHIYKIYMFIYLYLISVHCELEFWNKYLDQYNQNSSFPHGYLSMWYTDH